MGASHRSAAQSGTFTLDPASINAGATSNEDITITGLAVGDIIVVYPPDDLEAALVLQGWSIPAADTLRLRLLNATASPVDGASNAGWAYAWDDIT